MVSSFVSYTFHRVLPPPQGLSIEGLESTSFISVPVYLSGFKSGKGSITTSQLLFSLSETNHWSQITWGAFGKELWQQERSKQDFAVYLHCCQSQYFDWNPCSVFIYSIKQIPLLVFQAISLSSFFEIQLLEFMLFYCTLTFSYHNACGKCSQNRTAYNLA